MVGLGSRAKLLCPTSEGRAAVPADGPLHDAFASRLADEVGAEQPQRTLDDVTRLCKALDVLDPDRQ